MDFEEMKTKSPAELTELLAEKEEELRALRFKLQSQQLKQMHKVSAAKKEIARVQTLLNKKQPVSA